MGFTRALRISCRVSGSGVSASVVCPGFIHGMGMYADNVRDHGIAAPRAMGTCSPEAVVAAIVRAIERDRPEVLVTSRLLRPLLMFAAISPRLAEWLVRRAGGHVPFEVVARATGRARLTAPGRGDRR